MPQADYWEELCKNNEIASISKPGKLAVQDSSETIYEICLKAKPDSLGVTHSVWLHIHVEKPIRAKNDVGLFSQLLQSISGCKAAHLKSDYFRGKGKTWQQEQRDRLVQRCPVTQKFGDALLEKSTAANVSGKNKQKTGKRRK